MTEEELQFLEEVKAGERIYHQQREEDLKARKNLMIRNVLNSVFILLAIIAMVCILVGKYKHHNSVAWSGYMTGIVAVIIKMGETLMRFSTMARKPRQPRKMARDESNESIL